MRNHGRAVRNILAAAYSVVIVIVGIVMLASVSAFFNELHDKIMPRDPDVIDFIKGDWQ